MTLERARQILGRDGDGLTDRQLEGLLSALSVLAEIALEVAKEQHRLAKQGDEEAIAE